jgi:hypothetical protein
MSENVVRLDLRQTCCRLAQEIGWYLRFSGASRIEALVARGAAPVLEEVRLTVSGWLLTVAPEGDDLLAVYQRKA